jgi:hypothetical protein
MDWKRLTICLLPNVIFSSVKSKTGVGTVRKREMEIEKTIFVNGKLGDSRDKKGRLASSKLSSDMCGCT